MKKKVAGFLRLKARAEPKVEQLFVRVVTASKGGVFVASEDIPIIGGRQTAIDVIENLQLNFDCDCEPSRAYLLDQTRVPIMAAFGGRW